MNEVLGRKEIKSPNGELANILKKDIARLTNLIIPIAQDPSVFKDLKRIIASDFRSFDFGAIARKTVEYIIGDLYPQTKKQHELIKKIEALNEKGVALWIISYFHLIRVFGNEAVHHKDAKDRKPQYIDVQDLELGMYGLLRILDFYLRAKTM